MKFKMLLKFLGDLKQKQRVAVIAVSITSHSHTLLEEEDSDGDKVPAMELPLVQPENIPCAESINFLKILFPEICRGAMATPTPRFLPWELLAKYPPFLVRSKGE